MAKTNSNGILTAGGDSPGLNAAIRGVGKAAIGCYGMELIGIRDGFRGLIENHRMRLDKNTLANILTVGGTILGTSRDKPHRFNDNGRTRDMTQVLIRNYKKLGLSALVCLGGGGTQKNALRLAQELEKLTKLESRVTILGYVQRGGTPSAADRLLATRLGTACAELIHEGVFGVMVAARGEGSEPVPLEKVAAKRKTVPPDHPWIASARRVGTCLGD